MLLLLLNCLTKREIGRKTDSYYGATRIEVTHNYKLLLLKNYVPGGQISHVYNPSFSIGAAPTYTLTVTVFDGTSPGNDTKVLTVTTLTTTTPHLPNYNPPYFLPDFYSMELPVDTPPGEYVGPIFAYDDDEGRHS